MYYYDRELFIFDLLERWQKDKKTGQVYESAPFHYEIREVAAGGEDALCIISRDHAKTTSICKMLCLYLLVHGLEQSILLIMTKGLGEDVVGDMRKELETNSKIRAVYGNLVPIDTNNTKQEKWRQRELQLLNGTEIKAITKGEPIRGRRPTKVIIDDPQENKDVKNPRIASEFYDWVFDSVYPALPDSGSMIVLGTIISKNCFVNMLKQESVERDFKVIEYPALLDFDPKTDIEYVTDKAGLTRIKFKKGKPIWKDRWPIHKLERRCQKIGLKRFKQEYLNIPYSQNSSPVFDEAYPYKTIKSLSQDKNNVQWYRELKKKRSYYLGIDIANGRVGGDYSTIIVRDIECRLIAQYRGWCAQHILARITNDIVTKMSDFFIVPENNIGTAFLNACKDYDWMHNIYKKIELDKITEKRSEFLGWNTNGKTKLLMIDYMDEIMSEGTYEVSRELKEEIENYYFDEKGAMNAIAPYHDDLVIADALSLQAIKHGTRSPEISIF